MEDELQKRVMEIAKANQYNMTEQSGVESSLTVEDIQKYLQEVIKEVKK